MEQVKKHQRAQNIKHTDKTLKYETDDYPSYFEIRRMDEKPKSFSDFDVEDLMLGGFTNNTFILQPLVCD